MPQYSGMWTLSQVSQAVKNQTWTGLPPSIVEYLVVAGGGAGGAYQGGGGGAGGLLAGHVGITAGTSYFVTVGGGAPQAAGAGSPGTQGTNSVLIAASSGATTGNIVASGGGGGHGGGAGGGTGTSGGSGGGGASTTALLNGLSGISGQGNAGGKSGGQATNYASGGGGGAGTVGISVNTDAHPAGNGGSGIASSISGRVAVYAGGGGGGAADPNTFGLGGVGGGGNGGSFTAATNGDNATVNTGGGGGGGGNGTGTKGGAGGSGIVIVRYPGTTQFFTGGTLSYADGYVSHTFYANGVLAPTTPTLYANPDYQIARSLRFNSADQTYLGRTPATATNRRTFTWSGWVKRSVIGSGTQSIFTAYWDSNDGGYFNVLFRAGDDLAIQTWNIDARITTQLFRDPSAWYHIVVAVDTTQTLNIDRVKLYVNGAQVTSFATTGTIAQNTELAVNYNGTHYIGSLTTSSALLNGYQTECYLIDGQQLTPSSFGWTNPATGVWAPLDYVGSYGTNGFHLNFSDNTNTTAGTLGADSSGNGNNWTPNNFSVTAGAGNDSMVDVPTPYGTDTGVGGEVRGNYCTLNPLAITGAVPSNGNLAVSATSTQGNRISTFFLTSGKWYWEGKGTGYVGAITGLGGEGWTSSLSGSGSKSIGYWYGNLAYWDGGNSGTGTAYTDSDIIGIALDMDIGNVKFYKNNTLIHDLTFGSGTIPNLSTGVYPSYNVGGGTQSVDLNFGQRPFAYTAPSGFKALNTQNLPTPTIGATSATLASQFFAPVLYTGTSATRSVGVGFQPDFVWLKPRNTGSYGHKLFDSVRGATKYLETGGTDGEGTVSGLTSFDAGGFTVGSYVGTNSISYTFVAWNWKAGGTAVTNTSGSISSQVSASPASGFSVVTFTTDGTTKTVGHGLGVAPKLYIVKQTNGAGGPWYVFTTVIDGSLDYLVLNATDAKANSSYTAPTSTVFEYNDDNAATQVAYCFADVEGYSKFGKYTGNGNASGPFVHLGFRPAFLLIRSTGNLAGYQWFVFDNKRDPYNLTQNPLGAGIATAEPISASGYRELDMLSNGFKIRADGDQINYSTQEYIYMAFAENPFKYSLAR